MAGNSRSGRNPLPRAVHISQGTFRADRHGDAESGPPPAGGLPERPDDLDPIAADLWDHLAADPGFLSLVAQRRDTAMLKLLCQTWSLLQRAMQTANGNPLNKNARTAVVAYSSRFDAIASRFGLSPSDRQRLRTAPAEPSTSSKASRFFKGGA